MGDLANARDRLFDLVTAGLLQGERIITTRTTLTIGRIVNLI
jgi:hypothetical protein